MATYQERIRTVTCYEWWVPADEPHGTTYAEVQKAISAAVDKLNLLHGEGTQIFEDQITLHAEEDRIVVRVKDERVV